MRAGGITATVAVAMLGLATACGGSSAGRPTSQPLASPVVAQLTDTVTGFADNPLHDMVAMRLQTVARAMPRLKLLPDGTTRLFPGHRLVAFYGAAGAPGLGVLGTGSPEEVWPRLAQQAKPYTAARATVLPAYELISFVAIGSPGPQGTYASRIPDDTLRRYAAAARRHHALLVLDIQPGRGSFRADAKTLAPWLRRPDVGLAIDPEWQLYPGQRPLEQIGHTSARVINRVSRWLNRLTVRQHLPQKLLLIHQFTADMIRDKADVRARKHLGIVFNMDGFGGRAAKIGNYHRMAADDRFPLGMKLFYDADVDMMSPARVLQLHPKPAVVEYE